MSHLNLLAVKANEKGRDNSQKRLWMQGRLPQDTLRDLIQIAQTAPASTCRYARH
jgi:hypothetical protein